MSGEQFVPKGAIIVIGGVVQDALGQNLNASIQVQVQGEYEPLQASREGLMVLHGLLLEATAAIGRAMLNAPTEAENASKIVKASVLPPMPKGFKM